MSTAIVWLRRDLRLADNPALQAAAEQHDHVLPVYVHAPDEEAPWSPGAASRWWLHHSLKTLQPALAALGSPLLICCGPSLQTLLSIARTCGATAVYWNRLYEPALIARDRTIKEALRSEGIGAESFNGALLVEPWQLKTASGGPYKVFTPFWRTAAATFDALPAPLPAPDRLRAPSVASAGITLDALELLPRIAWDRGFYDCWKPGEAGAHARLETFAQQALDRYKDQRDLPGEAGTSQLSPHLHFGEIGPRQLAWHLRSLAQEGIATDPWLRQLVWREFAHHLLYHFPHTPDAPLDPRFANFPWRTRSQYATNLKAWQRGQTGIAIVDAGMRELWTSGWMHNRVRMIVASLLTKNLLIPWQEGARWFWDTLVDANLANNTLGWQWTAGCGADAAPYFRVFNPALQAEKFDHDGRYRQRWLPHEPIAPIVDLSASRTRALEAYARMKEAG